MGPIGPNRVQLFSSARVLILINIRGFLGSLIINRFSDFEKFSTKLTFWNIYYNIMECNYMRLELMTLFKQGKKNYLHVKSISKLKYVFLKRTFRKLMSKISQKSLVLFISNLGIFFKYNKTVLN